MKTFGKRQVISIVRLLAKLTVRRYKPGIIGITGSVGKTSTKDAIYTVLKTVRKVRRTPKNFNNEFGLPLTILGNWDHSGGLFFWTKVILFGIFQLLVKIPYPEMLVLEFGADKPGDIKYLLETAKPHIGVVTAVGEVPVHIEFYSGVEAIVREKGRLVEGLQSNGFAILNYDDADVLGMKERTRAHVLTYGFNDGAEVRITSFETRLYEKAPVGISFKLEYGGSFVPVRMDGVLGEGYAYAAAAASAIGIAFGIHLVRAADALSAFVPPPHRMNIVAGIKESVILDDTYNASPLSMESALKTIKSLPAKRRVGILGDMRELGSYSVAAHETLGKHAGKVFDMLVVIGAHGKLIVSQARSKRLSSRRIMVFETAEESITKIENLIKKGDLILIKASRGVGLDWIVDQIRQRT